MSENKDINVSAPSMTSATDGAVGVCNAEWYVAILRRPRCEKVAAEALSREGYCVYVATQKQFRVWSRGRRAVVDHVVIPGMVFIRCTEAERRQAAHCPYIAYYMVNRANGRKIAVIPDRQIEILKFMLGQTDVPVEFAAEVYQVGDRVRVIRGSLQGLVGEVMRGNESKSDVVINIDCLGCARLQIDTVNLKIVKE